VAAALALRRDTAANIRSAVDTYPTFTLNLAFSVDRNELLNPLAGFDLARIDVPHGIGGDAVDEVELSGHTAVVANRADGLS
jgi:hypothetical protein